MNSNINNEEIYSEKYICAASTRELKINGERIGLILQYDGKGNEIASFEVAEERAKLIVTSVNNHSKLIEALKNMTECAERFASLKINWMDKIDWAKKLLNEIEQETK
ncbi:MAG: hypothetical protein ABI091_26930 [Ferruginibacter sp.]